MVVGCAPWWTGQTERTAFLIVVGLPLPFHVRGESSDDPSNKKGARVDLAFSQVPRNTNYDHSICTPTPGRQGLSCGDCPETLSLHIGFALHQWRQEKRRRR
jgi:hypothetical protein